MDISLRNIMEELIEKSVSRLLEQYDCCKCEKCRLDIAAIALNRIKPHYLVTQKGEAMTINRYLSTDAQAEITAEVIQAIEKVTANPKHFEEEAVSGQPRKMFSK